MIIDKDNANSLEICKQVLLNRGSVVIPCDTIYGLSSVYPYGEIQLRNLKSRDANKPFLILATKDQAKEICSYIPDDILNIWPAPLTVLLNSKNNGKIGIRVPDDVWLLRLLESLGSPIYSTSVNISGEPALLKFSDIVDKFNKKIDLYVKSGEIQGTVPSTLIDSTTYPYTLIRKGCFDVKEKLNIKEIL